MQSRWMGFSGIVSFGWLGVYFRLASKEIPIDPIVSLFARLTCPIAILGSHFAIGMYWAYRKFRYICASRCGRGNAETAMESFKVVSKSQPPDPNHVTLPARLYRTCPAEHTDTLRHGHQTALS